MHDFDEHEREREKADEAANGRRGVWCETVRASIKAGHNSETAVAFATTVLQAFDRAFPEVREMAEREM